MSKKILLFVETTNHFGRSIVEGVSRFALERNWIIDFEQRGQYDPFPDWVTGWKGDGIIARSFNRHSIEVLRSTGLPFVELVGNINQQPADIVADENILGKMVADHFLDSGFRHFAFYAMERVGWTIQRFKGYHDYLAQKGFSCAFFTMPKTRSRFLNPQWNEGYRHLLKEWLKHLEKPTGLLAAVDFHAKKVIECCKDAKIHVPNDIAIVGVEDDPWFCRLINPPLSSIDANGKEVGYLAAVRLEQKMKKPGTSFPQIKVAPVFLTVRQSSDIIAVKDTEIAEILAYIRQNACDGINVNDLTATFNLSLRTIQRGIRKWLERTPEQEILRIRIETAKRLLRETSLPVSAIARRTGFSTAAYFIRAFRRECQITPSNYRKATKDPK